MGVNKPFYTNSQFQGFCNILKFHHDGCDKFKDWPLLTDRQMRPCNSTRADIPSRMMTIDIRVVALATNDQLSVSHVVFV